MEDSVARRRSAAAILALAAATLVLAGVLWGVRREAPQTAPDPAAEQAPNLFPPRGVFLNGQYYTVSAASLTLKGDAVTQEELRQALKVLTAVERVTMPDTTLGYYE